MDPDTKGVFRSTSTDVRPRECQCLSQTRQATVDWSSIGTPVLTAEPVFEAGVCDRSVTGFLKLMTPGNVP